MAKLMLFEGDKPSPPQRYPMCNSPGATRTKLAVILRRDLDIDITAHDLWTQQGAYRHATWDLARWGGHGHRWTGTTWLPVQVCSWDTMTDILRAGHVRIVSEDGGSVEISAGGV